MNGYRVQKAEREDSKAIWTIRYSPSVNSVSLDQTLRPFEEHDAWFQKKYFDGDENFCFVLKNETGEVVGYCRYDKNDEGVLVSIALSENVQGKGLGQFLLSESLRLLPTGTLVLATVLRQNLGSKKLFERNDFTLVREDENSFFFQKHV